MTTTRKCGKSVRGTEIQIGDTRMLGWKEYQTVTAVSHGRLAAGARYSDVTTADGNTERCWECFLYQLLWDMPLNLENTTVAELRAMPEC